MVTSGRQGAPFLRRYGRELVSKSAISLKNRWGRATVGRLKRRSLIKGPTPLQQVAAAAAAVAAAAAANILD